MTRWGEFDDLHHISGDTLKSTEEQPDLEQSKYWCSHVNRRFCVLWQCRRNLTHQDFPTSEGKSLCSVYHVLQAGETLIWGWLGPTVLCRWLGEQPVGMSCAFMKEVIPKGAKQQTTTTAVSLFLLVCLCLVLFCSTLPHHPQKW